MLDKQKVSRASASPRERQAHDFTKKEAFKCRDITTPSPLPPVTATTSAANGKRPHGNPSAKELIADAVTARTDLAAPPEEARAVKEPREAKKPRHQFTKRRNTEADDKSLAVRDLPTMGELEQARTDHRRKIVIREAERCAEEADEKPESEEGSNLQTIPACTAAGSALQSDRRLNQILMEAMVAQILCQFDQPFAGQPGGLASRQHSVDQAPLRANHLPVDNHLPARKFQLLRGIGHERLYHIRRESRIQFGAAPALSRPPGCLSLNELRESPRLSSRPTGSETEIMWVPRTAFFAFALDKAQ